MSYHLSLLVPGLSSLRNGGTLPPSATDANPNHRRSFYDNDDYGAELPAVTDLVPGLHSSLPMALQQQQASLPPQQSLYSQQRSQSRSNFSESSSSKFVTPSVANPSLAALASSSSPPAVAVAAAPAANVGSRRGTVEIPIQIITASNNHLSNQEKPKAFSTTKLTAVSSTAPSAASASQFRTPSSVAPALHSHDAQSSRQYPYLNPQQQQHRASPTASPNLVSARNNSQQSSCAECRAGNGNWSETDEEDGEGLGDGNFQRRSPTRDSYRNAIHSQQLVLEEDAAGGVGGGGGGGGKKDLIEKFADLNVRGFAISQG